MSATTTLTSEERQRILEARELARLAALYARCEQEGREPYDWELKNRPPLPLSPEEIRARILPARLARAAGMETANLPAGLQGDETGNPEPADGPEDVGVAGCGFYRVVRSGLHLGGVQNGIVLSGTVDLPYEFGSIGVGFVGLKFGVEGL